MNDFPLIISDDFQNAWIQAVVTLRNNKWEKWSLVVQINDILALDKVAHQKVTDFAIKNNLKKPKTVAYTIFPYVLWNNKISRMHLYEKYKHYFVSPKKGSNRRKFSWGSYFQRMIDYNGYNQLEEIIREINTRKKESCAAYTILIPKTGHETKAFRGAPCLQYLAFQFDKHSNSISLLAVYRNHDFLERAYGNYFGLCKLLQFIAENIKKKPGHITCISSHAYVDKKISILKKFFEKELKIDL
jgi:thymidylate synthase